MYSLERYKYEVYSANPASYFVRGIATGLIKTIDPYLRRYTTSTDPLNWLLQVSNGHRDVRMLCATQAVMFGSATFLSKIEMDEDMYVDIAYLAVTVGDLSCLKYLHGRYGAKIFPRYWTCPTCLALSRGFASKPLIQWLCNTHGTCDRCLRMATIRGNVELVALLQHTLGDKFPIFTVLYNAVHWGHPELLRWYIGTYRNTVTRDVLMDLLSQTKTQDHGLYSELYNVIHECCV